MFWLSTNNSSSILWQDLPAFYPIGLHHLASVSTKQEVCLKTQMPLLGIDWTLVRQRHDVTYILNA